MYMYVGQSENVYSKVQMQAATCKIKSSKLSSLIDPFRPFINQTYSMKLLFKSNILRFFYEFLRILKYG